jgi:hypothetical protein
VPARILTRAMGMLLLAIEFVVQGIIRSLRVGLQTG